VFPSRPEYEHLIYTLADAFPAVKQSTLTFIITSATAGLLKGGVTFQNHFEWRVIEVIDFAARQILDYSYTVYRGDEKILWYDPQPHPNDVTLQENFPHHKHTPPNIKRNRKPAPEIGFTHPNLPELIRVIAALE